ncbi:MAG: alanyl-tRNA editing protein [Alphaproteobacteria bacterium]|nr:MAG: alanyl-tRNA editing protein [Alphaproteobacteria bacterium]
MTRLLFREDAYRAEAPLRIRAVTAEGAIIPEASLFYPTGGGQPGDSGWIETGGRVLRIATARRGEGGAVLLIPEPGQELPPPGATGTQRIDWDIRHRLMRMHTALHLLSVVLPFPVTGGQIGPDRSRLDFDMPDPPGDPAAIEAALNALIAADHPVAEDWITDAELQANHGLVKTMAVRPPMGQGRVRLVRIGAGEPPIDLQPCGGTHVRSTGEIGRVALGRIEKKGRQNRRVSILLA